MKWFRSRPRPGLGLGAAACAVLLAFSPFAAGQQPQKSRPPKKTAAKQDPQATLAAAQAAIDQKDYGVAVMLLENFLLEQPGHVQALFNLAYCYSLLGRTADAVDMYRQTLEVDPKLFPAHLNLGLLLLDADQPAAAAEELKAAAELEPENYRAHFYLAAALESAGRKEEALERYRRAAALDPAQAEPRRALLALLLEKEDLAGAEAMLEELRVLSPEDPALLRLRGDLRLRQQKPDDALAAYEDYLKAQPDDAEVHLTVGRLYRERGEPEPALRHFAATERIGIDPYAWAGAYEQAQTLAAGKRYGEAIPFYRRALELKGDNADREVYADLGYALLENRQYAEAVPMLAEVVRTDPTRVEAYNHLASALTLSGDLAGANRVLDQRAAYAPETPGTLFLRARNYDQLRQCGLAIDYYERFLALNRDSRSDPYFQATGRLRLLRNVCRERRR